MQAHQLMCSESTPLIILMKARLIQLDTNMKYCMHRIYEIALFVTSLSVNVLPAKNQALCKNSTLIFNN